MTSRALAAVLVLALCPLTGGAQGVSDQTPPVQTYTRDDVPAHFAVVDGAVTLEREGQAQPADVNVALLAGDRVRTERGRAEILFGDGSALDLDNDTSVDFLSDSLIRLRTGRLRLSISRVSNEVEYRVDAAGCSALIHSAGDFSVAITNARRAAPEADLAVFRGTAELENAHGRTLVRAGQHAWAREDTEPSSAASFNSTAADDFDHWVEDQRDARTGSTSSEYLPSEMRAYSGAFDSYGTWGNEPSYGTVWYPQVSAGWQPYSDGYWSAYGSYGWFWVGPTVWSWPTHHYGRWGVSSGRWFWVPGHQWAPAWVSWATSPGYVGWCPIGVDGRPVAWFSGPGADGRRGWTMATANQFSAANGLGTVVRPQRTASLPDRALTPRTTAPVVASARPGASVPLHSPTTTRMAGTPRLDVGQPPGQARPGRVDSAPLVPASRAMRETDAAPQHAVPRSDQDRTPSWQSRPGEPRPAPTVGRPGVWSDPSSSPWRAQPRPTDGAATSSPDPRTSSGRGGDRPPDRSGAPDRPPTNRPPPDRSSSDRSSADHSSRMPQALPDRAAVPRNGPPPSAPQPSAGASRPTSPPPSSRGGQSSQSVPSRAGRGGTH
ncbi:MAG TPA: DUF6600 domain-containing protein [Vicinamibacterales bacterium]|nr:DUF6600 domain-containing protein [Vicinamibacterales bacterium]